MDPDDRVISCFISKKYLDRENFYRMLCEEELPVKDKLGRKSRNEFYNYVEMNKTNTQRESIPVKRNSLYTKLLAMQTSKVIILCVDAYLILYGFPDDITNLTNAAELLNFAYENKAWEQKSSKGHCSTEEYLRLRNILM